MKHVIVIAAIIALLPFNVAMSDRLSCDDPVDNEARIGFPGGLVVSVTEDASNKVCRFSVEGVSAGSPPQELIFEELRVLRGGLQNLASANHVDLARTFPILLAAASPEDAPDDDLLTDEFLSKAQVCFSMVSQGAAKPFAVVEAWDVDLSHLGFSCAYIRDGSDEWIESLNNYLGGSVRVEDLSGRKLILRNERDGLIEYLFVPLP